MLSKYNLANVLLKLKPVKLLIKMNSTGLPFAELAGVRPGEEGEFFGSTCKAELKKENMDEDESYTFK